MGVWERIKRPHGVALGQRLVVMAFGPSYSYSLIRLLYGQKWSDGEASTALQYYCLYVITLAMNGTSEAFLHAVTTENQIKRSNDPLLVFSLIYIIMNVVLIRSAGAVGLIVANSSSTLLPWVDNNCYGADLTVGSNSNGRSRVKPLDVTGGDTTSTLI
ncbi:hypothetical protein HYC85_025523 [Camellia sinensis]|uniref:Protein RFT1 homolog n=1 Tax=Camellia sinensis TaxID=4442 RepID=A0A7J7GBT1_CAMSI|nr:hypothetical protein HYC85_025523 [Camellia sinensis]